MTAALCIATIVSFAASTHGAPPLELIQTIPLPGVKHFEHFAADPKGNRLFCLAGVAEATLEVFDLRTLKHIHTVTGLKEGQQMVYREDVDRLCIVGGGGNSVKNEPGKVWIYDCKDYQLITSVDVPPGVAWYGFDPKTKYIYVCGNGRLLKKPDSTVSVIDTNAGKQINRFTLDDDVLVDFQLEASSPRMYVGERDKKVIAVVDRNTGTVTAKWPVTLGDGLGHMALDEPNHRLFVSCRFGTIVVFDTQTGRELQALPVSQWTDDLQFDPGSKRLFAGCEVRGSAHGSIDVIQQIDADHYKVLGQTATELSARNIIFIPEKALLFASVPQREGTDSHILVYRVSKD